MTLLLDSSHFFALDGNQPLAASKMSDLCGNDETMDAINSPVAQQTGPHATRLARFADGLGTTARYFDELSLSSASYLGYRQGATWECCFKTVDSVNAEPSRTLYSISNLLNIQWLVRHSRTDDTLKLVFSNGSGNTQYTLDFGVTLSLNTWYYAAVRKTVTSGSTDDNRINTYEFWCLPLSGSWTATPTNTLTSQANPSPASASSFHHVVGGRWNGSSVFNKASIYLAAMRSSSTARSSSFLQASFNELKNSTAGDTTVPVITNVSPSVATLIGLTQPVGFDVTDDVLLRRSMVVAYFAGRGIKEVVHDGDDWGPKYSAAPNTRTAISGGFRYSVLRSGGWPEAPTLIPYAIDTAGNEAA